MCRRRGLKINAGKSKVMVLNGEEGLESEVHVDRIHLEYVLEFKYLECVLGDSGTERAECSRKGASGRGIAGAIRSLVNARDLQLECDRVLHETLLVPVPVPRILWKERFRIMAVQINNLRGIRRMDRVPNTWIRELDGVKKGIYKRIDEGVLRWFGHMERDRIAKRV